MSVRRDWTEPWSFRRNRNFFASRPDQSAGERGRRGCSASRILVEALAVTGLYGQAASQNPDLRRAVLQATCYSGKVYGYLHLAKRIRDQEIASLNSELGRCMRGADQAVMLDPGCQELVRDGGRQYKKALNQSVNRLEGLASQASNGSKAIGFMYTSINRLGQTFWIAQRDAGDLGTRLVIGGTSSSADRRMRAALTGAAMAAITEEPFDSMSEMRPGQLPMTCEDF